MRLIDADELKRMLDEGVWNDVFEVVDNEPTAYDADKVVEQLEEQRAVAFLTLANTGDKESDFAYKKVADYLDKAIEIVKKGGTK